jgi:hypothetical protein
MRAQRRKAMSQAHPEHRMEVPISLAAYHQLLGGVSESGYKKEYWEIAAEAIDEWSRRHNPDAIAMPATRGYQWKNLFLPDGTLLRTVFGGKNHHCIVENDRILYNDQSVSPGRFINAVGGVRRNAWRSIWILFPENKEWKLADTLRTRPRTPHARKPRHSVQHGPAILPRAPSPTAALEPVQDQTEALAKNGPAESTVQHARADNLQPSGPNAEPHRRKQSPHSTRPAPPCHNGTDRRARRDDSVSLLLREELLPLLNRLCRLQEGACETCSAPRASHNAKDAGDFAPARLANAGYATLWSYRPT